MSESLTNHTAVTMNANFEAAVVHLLSICIYIFIFAPTFTRGKDLSYVIIIIMLIMSRYKIGRELVNRSRPRHGSSTGTRYVTKGFPTVGLLCVLISWPLVLCLVYRCWDFLERLNW